ncbi:hypothetical protein ATKI12_4089 [Kitasatospora sp. Ki12]|uniref:hypothetical protein n=1 Tax=Kitasatospora xanthocidica TaxID=83382 RepID=UPI00167C2DBB|nr:hypothetical protein [Kitasatospora xanthocidica]GHF37747.1 hypothetical protein GCM10018790_14290 [Kitasatospora xanthocidica]
MGLFSAKCPVGPEERVWIEESMAWLTAEFGREVLDRAPVLPTAEFFPGPYEGSEEDVRRVITRLCGYLGVAPERLTVEIEPDDGERGMADDLGLAYESRSAAGHYRRENGRPVIAVAQRQAARPVALVATVAHELGHVRLLDEQRITSDRRDHEPLTDLLTVHFGLGVFTANSAFDFSQDNHGWSYSRLGYLTERMFGYALACYAHLRGETDPAWARHLATNPRAYLKQGLRYLDRNPLSV